MKNMKQHLAVLLTFALIITGINMSGLTANAQEENNGTITVTLRVEDTNKTLIESTKVTINQEEAKNLQQIYQPSVETDSVETTTITAADVLAKQISLTSENLATDLTFSYGSPAHIVGENTEAYGPYWSFRVNNIAPADDSGYGYVANTCPVKDGDSIVYFRQACYDDTVGDYGAYTSYAYFDKDSYETTVGTPVELTYCYDDGWGYSITPGENMTITAGEQTATTDASGKASLTFDKAGTYIVHSTVTKQNDIPSKSLACATVTVTDNATSTEEPSASPSATPVVNPSATPVVNPSATPVVSPSATPVVDSTAPPTVAPTTTPKADSIKKPATPKNFKVKVNKGKKKNVSFSWKKVSKATGYVIKTSKKKKAGYKKLTTTKKTTATAKFKKGTHYITVQSYITVGKKNYYSASSKAIKVVIK